MSDPLLLVTPAEVRAHLRPLHLANKSVALVPTMGYLHAGHGELIRRAAAENDTVVVSVFVNPTQFAPTDDLAVYPRDLPGDLRLAGECGAAVLFHPAPADMYPHGHETTVSVRELSTRVEGAARPGHFDGVATVVSMLLNLVQPQRAYFGEKDWQQLAVLRRLAADLLFSTEIVGVPTVREKDGLALSSRNVRLSESERAEAPQIYAALRAIQAAAPSSATVGEALAHGREILAGTSIATEQLLLLNAALQEIPEETALGPELLHDGRLVYAGRLGSVRLIDNVPLTPSLR